MNSTPYKESDKWIDILDFIKNDVPKELKIGEMITSNEFNLSKAMSAMELMDKKVDPGMRSENENKSYKPPYNIKLKEIISIMDQLLTVEIAWLNGRSLGTTIYTCLYVHNPTNEYIENKYLLIYIQCLLKTCHKVREVVMNADIYEEEDFYVDRYPFDLASNINHDQIISSLTECEKDLENKIRKAKLISENNIKKLENLKDIQSLQDDKKEEIPLCEALLCRLRCRKSLYLVHQHLSKPNMRGLRSSKKFVDRTLRELDNWGNTLYMGGDDNNAIGFDTSVSALFFTQIVPTAVNLGTRKDAIKNIREFLQHIQRLYDIELYKNLDNSLMFLNSLSECNPSNAIRSHQYNMLGKYNINFMGENSSLITIVQNWFLKFAPACQALPGKKEWNYFCDRVARATFQIYKLYCDNRSRQRRRISKLLHDWSILQQEATVLDDQIRRSVTVPDNVTLYPFLSVVFEITCRLVCDYLLLGFELELYATHEYNMIYWYLQGIYNLRIQNIDRSRYSIWPIPKKKRKKKKLPTETIEQLLNFATYHMIMGILRSIQLCKKIGIHKINQYKLGSEELIFQHRFAKLRRIPNPQHFTYETYKEKNDLYINNPNYMNIENLKDVCTNSFKKAKEYYDRILKVSNLPKFQKDKFKNLIRLSVTNSVSLLSIDRNIKKFGGINNTYLNFNHTLSPMFPTLEIKQKQKQQLLSSNTITEQKSS